MPELPDLHVFANNLQQLVVGKSVSSAAVYNFRKVNVPSEYFNEKLAGASIVSIARTGKELNFKFSNAQNFNVHLMLNGRFHVCGAGENIKSKIIGLAFDDDTALVVSDFQGLCTVKLNPSVSRVPDAMSEAFTYEYFRKVTAKNAIVNIKALLIDQKIVRGIGNAYVDEILWQAGISPESFCGKIPDEYLQKLHAAIPAVLTDAIRSIERISPDIISGEERSFLAVHNPNKTHTDDGDLILKKTIAGKTTYYTERQIAFK
jgi:formamidopyrimidine-DNA glycosylase